MENLVDLTFFAQLLINFHVRLLSLVVLTDWMYGTLHCHPLIGNYLRLFSILRAVSYHFLIAVVFRRRRGRRFLGASTFPIIFDNRIRNPSCELCFQFRYQRMPRGCTEE